MGMLYFGSNRSSGENKAKALAEFLDGTHDCYRGEKRAEGAPTPLNELAQFFGRAAMGIFADHASSEQNALTKLESSHGLVPVGDGAHCFARLAERALNALGIGFEKDAKALIALTRGHTFLKELFRETCGHVPERSSETRFLNLYIVAKHVRQYETAYKDVYAVSKTTAWLKDQDMELRGEVEDVKRTITTDDFWKQAQLVEDFLIPFIKGCRMFDGAAPFTVCFMYKYLSMLAESVKVALEKHGVSMDARVRVAKAISKGWADYHFAMHSFALLTTPHFLADVRKMKRESEDEFKEARADTVDVAETSIRRFDPVKNAMRGEVLARDNPEVQALKNQFEDELDIMIDGGHATKQIKVPPNDMDPAMVHRIKGFGVLSRLAARLLPFSASTGPNERANYRESRVRTALRSRLKNSRAQGFLLASMVYNKAESPTRTWEDLMAIYSSFSTFSDEDEKYVDSYDEHMTRFEEADSDADRAMVEEGLAAPLGASDDDDDALLSTSATSAGPPAAGPPVATAGAPEGEGGPRRSQRRRILTPAMKALLAEGEDGGLDSDEDWSG